MKALKLQTNNDWLVHINLISLNAQESTLMASSSENYREKLIRNLEEEKVTEKYFTTDAHNQSYVTGLNEFLQVYTLNEAFF